MTFINKLDREGREPIELLDEIEEVLKIQCTPITWPIGMGSSTQGRLPPGCRIEFICTTRSAGEKAASISAIDGLHSDAASEALGDDRR